MLEFSRGTVKIKPENDFRNPEYLNLNSSLSGTAALQENNLTTENLMRFIHTADWHLGRIFHGMHLTEDQSRILAGIELLLGDEKPDAYVISGDIYDRAVPPTEAVELLSSHLEKVTRDLKVPVIIIAGNHDGAERLDFCSGMMSGSGLHISGIFRSGIPPVVIEDSHGPVYFYPVPYADPERMKLTLGEENTVTHNSGIAICIERIRASHPSGKRAVAMAHAFVNGGSASDSERPLSVGGAGIVDSSLFSGFCYTALGHLHGAQSINGTVRYSGSIMKYSISEACHKKSVSLVEIDREGNSSVEEIPLSAKRDLRIVEGTLGEILKGNDPCSREDYVAVKLTDREAVYDAMNRLREVYPNIIHMERTGFSPSDEKPRGERKLMLSELELFSSFYSSVTEDELSPEQGAFMRDIIEDSLKEEGENEAR